MSLVRVVHLGDLHLGPGPRNADRLAALDQALDMALASEGPVSVWVWPGDVNHGRMTIDDRNALAERLQRMAAAAPVLICQGNHDAPGDLDIFARLKTRYPIRVVTTPQVIDVPLAGGWATASVFVLPWPSKAGLVGAGIPHDQLGNEAAKALDVLFMHAGAQLEEARQAGRIMLMCGHISVVGAVASSGQPQVGQELEIAQSHLDRLGDIPKLLNHVHKHQEIGGAHFAGSLCRLDWGETEAKGYQEVMFDGMAWMVRFVPLDVPPRYHVEGQLSRDAFVWKCTNGPNGKEQDPPALWAGCDVRVRVTFPQAESEVLRPLLDTVVKAPFAGARTIQVEPQAIPDRALRAPELQAAKSLNEKLAVWSRLTGVTWTSTLTACATWLQSPEEPDAIVASVRARLEPLTQLEENPARDYAQVDRVPTAGARVRSHSLSLPIGDDDGD